MAFENLPSRLKQALRVHEPPLDSAQKLKEYQKEGGSWTAIPGVGEGYAHELEELLAESGDTGRVEEGDNGRPKIFISHKHLERDVEIANLVRTFFQYHTGNRVDVFQSSTATMGLRVDEEISEGLRRRLKEAELVVLVYTQPEHDWSFCAWETGLAIDPEQPENTKVAVLSCCGEKPEMFRNRQIIDAHDPESVRGFVNEALASSDFLPRYGKALTHWENQRELDNIADTFCENLAEHIRPYEETSYWYFWPWLQLELPLTQAQHLKQFLEEGDEDAAGEIVWKQCKVKSDHGTGQMLRRQTLEDSSLDELRRVADRAGDVGWVDELYEGVVSATAGDWPETKWCHIYDEHSNRRRVLLMLHRKKIPSQSRFVFSVCFPPALDQSNEAG